MGWLLRQHERTKQWKIWSTITDSYRTDWLDEAELKAELASVYEEEYKLKVIELYWTFPHGWTEKETHKRLENRDALMAFHTWNEQAMSSEDYEGEIDRKFKEVTGRDDKHNKQAEEER